MLLAERSGGFPPPTHPMQKSSFNCTHLCYTMHMLEHVIVRAKIANSGWGNDIIPDNKLVEASAADAVR